eukprot:CCRYP_002954-RA/>CCRYP_002954-RA protein AED:0.38 eAED:0.38 QI:0/0/0/1/0/0/2/0/394
MNDGWIYIKVIRGMYGLSQAGSLGHALLKERLNKEGYFHSQIVPGLWKHKTRSLQFILVVDDFGIKYLKQADLDHLIAALKKYCDVTVDLEGKEYSPLVHGALPPEGPATIRQLGSNPASRLTVSPHEPKYAVKQQFANYDMSTPAGKEDQKHVQLVTGKFNWYAHGIDGTMLMPISALAAQQAKPMQATMKRVQHFLNYAATQEPAVTTYRASNMFLAIHSDAGYLNKDGARSRAGGGHHFLSENVPNPSNNGAIYKEASIIKSVMSSTAEAELDALYTNAHKGIEIRHILDKMGHKKPLTPVQTDNSMADGIINSQVQPKHTKAMDMCFHWLQDRAVNQNQFCFYWRPGLLQRGDYWTKHHPPSHHCNMRSEILTSYKIVTDFCVKIKCLRT